MSDIYIGDQYREVRFDKYCKTCKYKDIRGEEDPCDECLSEPANLYTDRPVNWKEEE